MAWIMDSNDHIPVDVWFPDLEAAKNRDTKLRKELLRTLPQHPRWHPEHVQYTGFSAGILHPPITEPFRAKITRFKPPLLGIFSAVVGKAVSATAIELIELVDPGAHRYIPFDLTMPDDSPTDESYKILNIGHRLDSIAIEQSANITKRYPDPEEHPEWFYYYCGLGKYGDAAVYKDRIAGRSIWFDWRLNKIMLSDEIIDLFLAHDIVRLEEKKPYFLFHLREV